MIPPLDSPPIGEESGFRGQRDQEAAQEDAQAQEEEAAQARAAQAQALACSSHRVATSRETLGPWWICSSPRCSASLRNVGRKRGLRLPFLNSARLRLAARTARPELAAPALKSDSRGLGSVLRGETGGSAAAWSYMTLFFLHFSLDGGKKTLLASFATVALLPRIAAVRRHKAFKSPVPGSDRGGSHQ